ncbi:PTS sugar transporter subunit IIB [Alkaliphilus peptidifermentans]|uniref:PTS system, ascorbate-specific IIB component n=1 Tax=Alkaliphilus peptidifermentans DSM 18978 TaxID=1120976 RepID=A0A1G5KNW5_9FIRM|nr:PTS sugar transporter subunit IIB [Alkaliphilus peptidifermentans]SCZ01788.1 PTS system, ascorbate-specific IIB component [Alkaliphilus peptidifermentans DSM 18978]
MKKILVVCTSGLGTSLAMRLFIEKFARENNLNIWVEHSDIGSASYIKADLIIGAKQVIDCLPEQNQTETIALKDIVNRHYISERLFNSNIIQKWLNEKEGTQ